MATSTRRPPASLDVPAAAAALPTVDVAVDGTIRSYPDVTPLYLAWQKDRGALAKILGRWAADRQAAEMLSTCASIEGIHLWCYLDDNPVAYLVKYTRKPGSRAPRAEIVGASRYGKDVIPE
jgi:hypothetical protein